jgi:hypothetical protein
MLLRKLSLAVAPALKPLSGVADSLMSPVSWADSRLFCQGVT